MTRSSFSPIRGGTATSYRVRPIHLAGNHVILVTMKATIDLDDTLYRRLKVEAARRGRTIRELVADGVERVLQTPEETLTAGTGQVAQATPWFGLLRGYAQNAAGGKHDLTAIRASIAAGRRKRRL